MRFVPTPFDGAWVLELETLEDPRGFFARSFCRAEFERRGLDPNVEQCNVSWNVERGTLRGLHYQSSPQAEAKLVRCTRGAVYDVIVDIRKDSPTRREWFCVELTADNRRALYVPKGFAHGFQTLEAGSEVYYQMSVAYEPTAARGVRWDDPALDIRWPLPEPVVSERDRSLPFLDE